MLIIVMGVELLRSSVEKIFNPQPLEFSFISIIILIFSILLKMWMAKFNKRLGDKVDSMGNESHSNRQFIRIV